MRHTLSSLSLLMMSLTLPLQAETLRLLDINGNALAFNQTARSYLINAGDSEFDFMAALESTGSHVSNGEFSSLIRLKMEYL